MTQHATLAEALGAFQAEVPRMSRDERADVRGETKDGRSYNRSYGYASLDQFVEIVEPVLGRHGLSITSAPDFTPHGYALKVTLLHESGEERSGWWPLPDPSRYGPQDIGSSMTYGRRYVGWGLAGVFPGGEDDDGRKAQEASRESWDSATPARQPSRAAAGQGKPTDTRAAEDPKPRTWTDAEVTDMHAKLTQLDLDKAGRLYDWMAHWNLHNRPIPVADDAPDARITATQVLALRLADSALEPTNLPVDEEAAELLGLRDFADGRGLLKVQVSETETLDQVLAGAEELVQAMRLETENAQKLRQDASASWQDEPSNAPGD